MQSAVMMWPGMTTLARIPAWCAQTYDRRCQRRRALEWNTHIRGFSRAKFNVVLTSKFLADPQQVIQRRCTRANQGQVIRTGKIIWCLICNMTAHTRAFSITLSWSSHRLNRCGVSTDPSLIPLCMQNGADTEPLHLGLDSIKSYQFLKSLRNSYLL